MKSYRTIVVTMYSPAYQELADIALPNLKEYCNLHGYEMRVIEIEDQKFAYKKHEFFKEVFDKDEADLIWYRDIDGIITNMKIPVGQYLKEHYSVYLTKDANEINGGSLLLCNTPLGRMFNDMVLENRDMFENEQNFFNSMPNLMFGVNYMYLLPQGTINAYDYSLYEHHPEYRGMEDLGDWTENSLFIHFPGISIRHRAEMMKEYLNNVTR